MACHFIGSYFNNEDINTKDFLKAGNVKNEPFLN